jgi:predicted O-methyltransferase YrrM
VEYNFNDENCNYHNWFSTEDSGRYVSPVTNFKTFLTPMKGCPLHFLEIGSFEGRSATWCLDNILTHDDSHLDCVEIAEGDDCWFYQNLKYNLSDHMKTGKCKLITGASNSVLPKLIQEGEKYDFIYVDGSHDTKSILEDTILSFLVLKVGGLMSLDDYDCQQRFNNESHELSEQEVNTGVYNINGVNLFVPHQGLPKQAIDSFLLCYRDYIEVLHAQHQVWIRRIK